MTPERGGFFRDNLFLVAAVSLPLVVVAFFLLAMAIPRWTVPAPGYDALLRATPPYDAAGQRLAVEFSVRDGRVEARIRALAANTYEQPPLLFLFDHATMNVRQIPIDYPADMHEGDAPRTLVIDALAGRRVVADLVAPDGYRLESRGQRGRGLMGDLFGMNRYGVDATLVNKGRIVRVALPIRYEYQSPATLVGWIVDGAR
jgi:hypothetical protein